MIALVLPLIFVVLLSATCAYSFFVSAVVYTGLQQDCEHPCIVAAGRQHATFCCMVAQRTLHMFGAYNPLMARLARHRYRVESRPGQICFFGDSGFALWKNTPQTMRGQGVDGFNVAFGGSTSAQCLHFFDALVLSRSPALTVVHLGSNDYEIGEKVDDVARRVRYMQRAASGVFVLGPRKPAYTDDKLRFMTELASKCHPTMDLSDVKLAYHTDGLHPTSRSLCSRFAPPLARALIHHLRAVTA